ncbi:MYND finger protein, putative [Perkinsus marinus ATCC 50983]|uniref:MYND finger protein, putative n=1 Tax=Perkinsus marinus (strain ATCC 50983 / TXsc) TaxID=423536 RepID=C5LMP3_PERM5|nr:MYND finger protein, putative [Perkinsus marinus ATCC 50983]EER01934.1 MYND finger protein, putative [Perkinsus marinus ATCC 50983]|eukprot:XP_002769216.1 MYND finger protein, putative [Perkinsus marinus ATCC 50983]
MITEVGDFACESALIDESPSSWALESIGSSEWLENHAVLERLNKEAHAQAVDGTDEFIKDSFVREDRIKDLIGELILIWTWKTQAYPLISSRLAKLSSLRNYVPLYHEATVINLLEVFLFHQDGVEAAGDATVDLVDYCSSKLAGLLELHAKRIKQSVQLAEESSEDRRQRLIAQTDQEVLDTQYDEIEFQVCMCTLSIIRFLCEHRAHCPLTLTTRLLETHDILMTLVPILEAAPWIRKTSDGRVEKFEDNNWKPMSGDATGSVKMPKAQGQVWLAIYQLLMDPVCRQQYSLDSQCRVDNLLRLRKYLNETVFEQLPVLSVLLRALEELAISGRMVAGVGDSSNPFGGLSMSSGAASAFSVELVAEIIEGLKSKYRGKWKEAAENQLSDLEAADKKEGPGGLKKLSKMVSIPDEWRLAMEESGGELQTPKCPECGKDADQRCTRCKREFYCSRQCQVAHWRIHREHCRLIQAGS